MRVRQLLRFAFLAGLLAWTPQASAQNGGRGNDNDPYEWSYEVRGPSTQDSTDRPWSIQFDHEDQAIAARQNLKEAHSSGGLSATAPDKPTDLYIQPYKRLKSSGGPWERAARIEDDVVRRPMLSAPPKLPSVDPGPYLSSKPNYPADDPRGTEGAYNNPTAKKPADNTLAGSVWNADSLSSYGGELRFGKDGKTVTHFTNGGGPHPADTYSGAYKIDGNKLTMELEGNGRKWSYTGTVDQARISGTYRIEGVEYTYKWHVEQK